MTRTEWNEWKADNSGDYSALKSLADDEGIDLDLVDADTAKSMVQSALDNGGMYGVCCCLEDIDPAHYNDDWFGTENDSLVPAESWNSYANELENEMNIEEDDDEYLCDKCNKTTEVVHTIREWFEILKDEDAEGNKSILDVKDKIIAYAVDNYDDYDTYCFDCFKEYIHQVNDMSAS